MSSSQRLSPVAPIVALALAAAHVGYEHFSGGVKTHHFLARADMPGFSNWLGLLVLPALGVLFAVRVRSARSSNAQGIVPRALIAGAIGSLAYGAALAASFLLGLQQVGLVLFLGLFACAVALPIFRAEYIAGFVVGMTTAFGSVIPLTFALFFAALSFALRWAGVFIWTAMRRPRR